MKSIISSEKLWALCLGFVFAYAAFLVPTDAFAQAVTISGSGTIGGGSSGGGGGTIGNMLCNVANWFKGPIGRGIATLAIIVIGVGALMGKVSWGMAIIVGIGIAVIFGAPTIVNELGAGGGGC